MRKHYCSWLTSLSLLIVCDITLESILGQNFLLQHIKTWDFDVPCLHTRQITIISLVSGGETEMVWCVLVQSKIQIPHTSFSFISVDIVSGKKLAANAYFEGISDDKQFTVVPGIVDPHKEEKCLAVMNRGDEDITLYPWNFNCSYEAADESYKVRIAMKDNKGDQDIDTRKDACTQVPSNLEEMFIKSSEHLNEEEKDLFSKLLIKVENVFAKSSGDFG